MRISDWSSDVCSSDLLRKNFSGIELDAQQGITDEGDGANFNISATVGTNFADGRGNIVLSASYLDRKDIFPQTSRKFFREYQPLSLHNNGLALAQGNNLYDPAVLAATFAASGVTPPPGLGEEIGRASWRGSVWQDV